VPPSIEFLVAFEEWLYWLAFGGLIVGVLALIFSE